MKKLKFVLGYLMVLSTSAVTAQSPYQDIAAIETEMARQLWISDTVIGYHDLANRIGMLQGQIGVAEADQHMKSLGAWFFQNEAGEAQLADARNRLNGAIAGYLGQVSQAAWGQNWPFGAEQQAYAQSVLTGVNNYYPQFLQYNLDPAPLVIQIALVAGWARGEVDIANPFAGHLERVRDAYQDARIRTRIAAARAPLPAVGGGVAAGPATPAYSPPQTYTPPLQPAPVEQPPIQVDAGGDFFDALRSGGYEMDVDRPGMDIQSFDLEADDPALCMQACTETAGCQSFTYVKPGAQSSGARCWLKGGVPPAVQNGCCISGVP